MSRGRGGWQAEKCSQQPWPALVGVRVHRRRVHGWVGHKPRIVLAAGIACTPSASHSQRLRPAAAHKGGRLSLRLWRSVVQLRFG